MKEKHSRSIVKMISWRVLASVATILLIFIFTKRLDLSVTIGVAEVLLKMGLYYTHERAWNKINWGKRL